MSDYIKRADAIEAVESLPNTPNGYSDTYDKACIIGLLEALPSAELPKGDLISRADVLKYPIRLDHYDEENGSREFVYGVESVIEYVESLPSADAVQGKWKAHRVSLDFICSNCGEACWSDFDYCPHCGARMKGGTE